MLLLGAIAFLFIIALLAIPVEIAFNIQRREMFYSSFSIGWLFGVVRLPLKMNGSEPSSKPQKRKKKRKGGESGRRTIAIAGNKSFRLRLIRFFKDIIGAVQVSGLTLRARLGLDDPADTGMLWGFIGPFSVLLAGIRKAVIRIEPEFMNETFEFESKGEIRVVPLKVITIIVFFILSPVTIRMIWMLR